MVFAHGNPVEHRVEAGGFENLNFGDVHDLCASSHGNQAQKVIGFYLSKYYKRNTG